MSKKKKNQSKKKTADQLISADSSQRDKKAGVSAERATDENIFAQYFSFSLLLIAIVLVGILFYEVMAAFWIPLFLAAVLVVVFRPWYDWIRKRLNTRDWIAAAVTAVSVLLVVLGPIAVLLFLAAAESQQVLSRVNSVQIIENANQVRAKLGLDLPPAVVQTQAQLQQLTDGASFNHETRDLHRASLFEIEYQANELANVWGLPKPEKLLKNADADSQPSTKGLVAEKWKSFVDQLVKAKRQYEDLDWILDGSAADSSADNETALGGVSQKPLEKFHDYKLELSELATAFDSLKIEQQGGKARAWATTLLNPTEEQVDAYVEEATSYFSDQLVFLGGKGISFILLSLIGALVMIVAFYFFLLDGHSMIEAFKRLSPLDDEHEQELVAEFSSVSRAVVVATLLSAIVQGLLAGVGFYFVGLESIFLLTVLSAVLAMVPFLGAASVWVPCALYLYFVDNNLPAAIGLAVYGAAVVSMADNVIKPIVLHGHSKLHPLFAFLSVIGGVAALGPIGILIGPMIVAFLQTLLEILENEMKAMDGAPE